jgi:hypothetical protein
MFNLDGKIGGDAELSPRGELYARKLPALVRESVGVSQNSIPFPNLVLKIHVVREPMLIFKGRSPFNCLDFDSQAHNRNCSFPT